MKTLLALLLISATAFGSSVTATITDSDSQTWNNGIWTVTLFSPNGPPTVSGTPVTTTHASGTLSGSGVLSATLTDTSTIDQSNAQWCFTITPNAAVLPSSPICTTVVGATPSLSAVLSAGIVAPRFPAGLSAYGYLDKEVSFPVLGSSYYNVSTPCYRQFSQTGWTCGSGGGAVTFDQIGSGTNLGHGLVVGSGSVLSTASGGFINANEINGGVMPAANSIPVINSTGGGQLVASSATDNGTAFSSTEPITSSVSLTATTDGVHAGILSLVGNTANPTIPANQFGWLGFNSTSATAYFLQPSTTAPNGNFLQCAAPSGGVSACSWASAGGLPTGTTGQTVFYAAGGTTGTATSAVSVAGAASTAFVGIDNTAPIGSLDVGGPLYQETPYTGTVTLGASLSATATTATLSGGTALNPNGGVVLVGFQDGSSDQEFICYSAATSTTMTIGGGNCQTPVTTNGRSYYGSTAAVHNNGVQVVMVTSLSTPSVSTNPTTYILGNGGNGNVIFGSINANSLGHSTGAMFGQTVYFSNGTAFCTSIFGGQCGLSQNGSFVHTNSSNNPVSVVAGANLDYAITTQGITGNGTLTAITNAQTPTMPNNNTTAAAGAGGVLSSHCTIIWNQATAGTVAFGIKASAAPTGIWVKEQDSGGTYTAPAYTTITSATTTQTSGTVVPSAFGTTFASDLWIAMNPGNSNSVQIQLYASASLNTLTIEPGTGCTAWQ